MPRPIKPLPPNWSEVMAKVDKGQMTMAQAAKELGISPAWLYNLRHRENPGRKDRRAENMRKVGMANRRKTVLEANFSDYLMCKAIKAIDKCDRCPKRCNGQRQYKGLVRDLLEKTPLNADQKPLEEP